MPSMFSEKERETEIKKVMKVCLTIQSYKFIHGSKNEILFGNQISFVQMEILLVLKIMKRRNTRL